MAHVSDFTQEEDQILLDLINFDNSINLSLQQVNLEQLSDAGDGRVSLTLTPRPNSGYKDNVAITYTRLDIQTFMDIYHPAGLLIPQGDAVNVSDLLDDINTALGTAIPLDSIVDAPIGIWDGTPNEEKVVTFQIDEVASLVYSGNALVSLDGNDIPLESIVTTRVLSGLNYPTGEVEE